MLFLIGMGFMAAFIFFCWALTVFGFGLLPAFVYNGIFTLMIVVCCMLIVYFNEES